MSHSPCFDACKAINPNNPEKVAETLPEIFKMLQALSDFRHITSDEFEAKYPQYAGLGTNTIWGDMAIDAKHLIEKATDNLPF